MTQSSPASISTQYVCPFCGIILSMTTGGQACPRCTLENSAVVRQATKIRIGPWYVLQSRNPAAPGMKFSVLSALVKKGQVTSRSVVRGPTTHQLWRFAGKVKGLSRELGLCYACGGSVKPTDHLCSQCRCNQEPPADEEAFLEVLDSNASAPVKPHVVMREIPLLPSSNAETSAESAKPVNEPATEAAPAYKPIALRDMLTPRDVAAVFQVEYRPRPAKNPRRLIKAVAGVILLIGVGSVITAVVSTSDDERVREPSASVVEATKPHPTIDIVAKNPVAPLIWPNVIPSKPVEAKAVEPVPVRPALTDQALHAVASIDSFSGIPEPVVLKPAPAPAVIPAPVTPKPEVRKVEVPKIDPPVAPVPSIPVVASPPATRPAVVVEVDPSILAAKADIARLWSAGQDAEARSDWRAAQKAYEQIESMPNTLWPAGLQSHLRTARGNIKWP